MTIRVMYGIIKDISISSSWIRPYDKLRGRKVCKRFRTEARKKRQALGKERLFMDETYFGYEKNSFGSESIQTNYWNEGPRL